MTSERGGASPRCQPPVISVSHPIMTPKSYFSLRSNLGPQPSILPGLFVGLLAVVTVVGVFFSV